MKNNKTRLFEIMSKLDNSFKLRIDEDVQSDIDESGFSRLANTVAGNVKSIDTYGIFTSENPMAIQTDKAENSQRLNQLKADLRSKGYGYVKLVGMYGIVENSLGVPNIKYNDIKELSEKYEQESFVFGVKVNHGDETYFKWDMIETATNQPMDKSRFTILSNRENVSNSDDFYSMIKKVKFQIPFYNDNYTEPEIKQSQNKLVNQQNVTVN